MKTFYQVENCIKTKLLVQTWDQFFIPDQVEYQVRDQVRGQVRYQVWDQINECI